MWPWEHAIMGYLVYSLFCHLYYRDSPGGLETFAVVFAPLLPDIIDKPLAWEFSVFETGYALGHSIFFAIPLSIAVGVFARSHRKTRTGIAFGIGYLLHLPADILDGYVRDDHLTFEILFWPFVIVEPYGNNHGFINQFLALFARYQQELFAGELSIYIWFQLGMAISTFLLWLYDGAPVLRGCLLSVEQVTRKLRENT